MSNHTPADTREKMIERMRDEVADVERRISEALDEIARPAAPLERPGASARRIEDQSKALWGLVNERDRYLHTLTAALYLR